MAMMQDLNKRLAAMFASPGIVVVPVGDPARPDRGILTVAGTRMGHLAAAVKVAFSAVVIAAALSSATPAHAQGVGYDADVYGQSQRQVMQQGSAMQMTVASVRPVKIEVASPARQGNQVAGYAVTAAGGAVGAIVGNQMGKSSSGKQIGTILGGLAGAVMGNLANEALQGSQGPQKAAQIDGAEITMINPATNQVVVITQAGGQAFTKGDAVLVVSAGGTARVVADKGQTQALGHASLAPATARVPLLHGLALEDTVGMVLRSAKVLGIQVDANKVASVLETGIGERDGQFTGRVVGVDAAHGVVFQSTGRGMGVVHAMTALNRVPAVGEIATIRMRDGWGAVDDRRAQELAVGGGR